MQAAHVETLLVIGTVPDRLRPYTRSFFADVKLYEIWSAHDLHARNYH
jgi:hypothetical protein